MPNRQMAKTTIGVALLLAVARLTGFARSQVMASFFGAGTEMDAYIVARSVAMIATILTGPISVTFMTIYAFKMAQGQQRAANKLKASVVSISCIVMLCQVAILMMLAPQITQLVGPGFAAAVYKKAVAQARLMLPFMLFPLLAALSKSVLNTHKTFSAPVVADILEHVVVIALIVKLGPVYGADSLSIAAVLGWVVLFAFQWFFLWRRNLWSGWSLTLTEDTRKVMVLALPLVGGSILSGVYHVVDRALASRLPAGSMAILEYAERLRGVPLGILVAAATTVLYPALSGMWGRGDSRSFSDTIMSGLRFVEFICIPAAAGIMVLAKPITKLAFQRGAFTAEATESTARALVAFAPGLVAAAGLQTMNAAFMSLQKTALPVILGVIMSAVNIGLDLALVGSMGFSGLALANSLAAFVTMFVGLLLLRKHSPGVSLKVLMASLGKVMIASTIMAAVVLKTYQTLGFFQGTGSALKDAAGVLGVATIGAGIYVIVTMILGCEELKIWRKN